MVSVCMFCVFFFFSSRRRHTRCSRDWSSDVCSSDLHPEVRAEAPQASQQLVELARGREDIASSQGGEHLLAHLTVVSVRADDLEVLVGVPVSDTTLQPDEHGGTIHATETRSKGNRRNAVDFRHYTSCAIESSIQQ